MGLLDCFAKSWASVGNVYERIHHCAMGSYFFFDCVRQGQTMPISAKMLDFVTSRYCMHAPRKCQR